MRFKKENRSIRFLISAPFIYFAIFPLVILDIFVELFHRICFPLYGLAYVIRSNYILIDRQKLSYLSTSEKINCMYCGYANGLLNYVSEIAGVTESYWCGIKHADKDGFIPTKHQKDFLEYNNEEQFKMFLKE